MRFIGRLLIWGFAIYGFLQFLPYGVEQYNHISDSVESSSIFSRFIQPKKKNDRVGRAVEHVTNTAKSEVLGIADENIASSTGGLKKQFCEEFISKIGLECKKETPKKK